MDLSIIFFFAGILILAGIVFALISLTKKGSRYLDVVRYQQKWLSIEQQLQRDHVASFQLCILNADKLLDQALKEKGVKGDTIAERLKSISTQLSRRDAIWSAHKLRNRIAHETDVVVTYEAARIALKDIGAI
jgi:hypothetical protein